MDTTPLWILAGTAVVTWPTALLVMWHQIRKAPVVTGDAVMTEDDRWSELALAEYNTPSGAALQMRDQGGAI